MLGPYVERLILRQLSPHVLGRRLKRLGFEVADAGSELPHRLRRILGDLERGDLQIGVRPEDFEPLVSRLEQLANRIVLGIIVAALIAGLAVLLSTSQLAGLEQWIRTLFAAGLLVVTVLGLYLAWTIVRTLRH
jgi:ubiquinone biosynthesis protein